MSERESATLRAEERQLEVLLGEVCGVRPAPDLVERVLGRVDAARVAPRVLPARSWLAAALLVAGVGVVIAVAFRQHRDQTRAALPVETNREQEQDKPPQDQQPDLDPALRRRIERAITALEIVEQRDAAIGELAQVGPAAAPLLDAAIRSDAARAQVDLLDALQMARFRVDKSAAKAAFGWPVEPVTVFADYSDNRVVAVNAAGETVWHAKDMFGVWDAELTPTGTLLVTEFSVSQVCEIDGKGRVLWSYENLKNPYDADRLPNGNTLIADTFGGRVIEVNPTKEVVWEFSDNVRPFDCDRLPNGNTLIADVLKERVVEVDREAKIVWEYACGPLAHDVDRLANGNTLITLRESKKLIEVDRAGKIVFELAGLNHPSDADRLPNGHTLVAENAVVREFDRAGKEVWRHAATWAVEVGRY